MHNRAGLGAITITALALTLTSCDNQPTTSAPPAPETTTNQSTTPPAPAGPTHGHTGPENGHTGEPGPHKEYSVAEELEARPILPDLPDNPTDRDRCNALIGATCTEQDMADYLEFAQEMGEAIERVHATETTTAETREERWEREGTPQELIDNCFGYDSIWSTEYCKEIGVL